MLFSNQEIISFWHPKHFTKAKLSTFQGFNISENSKRFIVEVRLPKEIDTFCFLKFNLELEQLPKIQTIFKENFETQKTINGLCIIGFADDDPICLDTRNGQILLFNLDFDAPFCFINSSIEKFASSLISYQQHQKKAKDENLYDDKSYYKLTLSLKKIKIN